MLELSIEELFHKNIELMYEVWFLPYMLMDNKRIQEDESDPIIKQINETIQKARNLHIDRMMKSISNLIILREKNEKELLIKKYKYNKKWVDKLLKNNKEMEQKTKEFIKTLDIIDNW